MIDFYGVNIDRPLSADNNQPDWDNSRLGQLYAESNQEIYLLEYKGWVRPEYIWRVVDYQWIQEDNIMTHFRAFDLDGVARPDAAFGVSWDGNTRQIKGGFRFDLEYGNNYYVPVNNDFTTPNAGGYKVTVLDQENASETMAFGLKTGGVIRHQAAVITFRLFPVGDDYPNDF